MGDIGIDLDFDWRDYATSIMVCRITLDGEPPAGYLVNAGRQVRFHLSRVLPRQGRPPKLKRFKDTQEYLSDSFQLSMTSLEVDASRLRESIDQVIEVARQLFADASTRQLEPAMSFPQRTYVQVVPPPTLAAPSG
jgi:hypothetical protein